MLGLYLSKRDPIQMCEMKLIHRSKSPPWCTRAVLHQGGPAYLSNRRALQTHLFPQLYACHCHALLASLLQIGHYNIYDYRDDYRLSIIHILECW